MKKVIGYFKNYFFPQPFHINVIMSDEHFAKHIVPSNEHSTNRLTYNITFENNGKYEVLNELEGAPITEKIAKSYLYYVDEKLSTKELFDKWYRNIYLKEAV